MKAVNVIAALILSLCAAVLVPFVVSFWQADGTALSFNEGAYWGAVLSAWALILAVLLLLQVLPLEGGIDNREEGVVKWFNGSKGFGFITRENDEDVFVHFRSIRGRGHRTLHEGQRVRFGVVESDKGLQAEDVSVVRHQ